MMLLLPLVTRKPGEYEVCALGLGCCGELRTFSLPAASLDSSPTMSPQFLHICVLHNLLLCHIHTGAATEGFYVSSAQ